MNEMMPDTGRFATTGVMDEAFLRSHVRYTGAGRTAMLLALGYLLAALLETGMFLWIGDGLHLAVAAVCAVMLCWRPRRYLRRWLKLNVDRLKETSPEGEMLYTVSCTERGVMVENQTNGGSVTIEYGHIDRVIETEETLLVLSRAKQMTAFFKSSLTEVECEALAAYLQSRGVKVKNL